MKHKGYRLLVLLLLSFTTMWGSHSGVTERVRIDKGFLVESSLLLEVSREDLNAAASQYKIPAFLLKHQLTVEKIVYKTKYNGKEINASGLIFLPKDVTKPLPVVSVQHGTIIGKNEAPTKAYHYYKQFEMLASAGFAIFIPDYIGYGSSEDVFHPYYDYEHSAQCVIDMIRAGRELLSNRKISFSDKLYLAGYSEGGYVTLAAHKKIQQSPELGLTVTASAAGAGGYDLKEVMSSAVLGTKSYPAPAYLAFLLTAYNTTYSWGKPLEYFFLPQQAAKIPSYMSGKFYSYTVNNYLPSELSKLFNPDFYNKLKSFEEKDLLKRLHENSVHSFQSDSKILLYHGTADEIVPYSSSVTTVEALKKNGCSDVELITIDGGTHGSSFSSMLIEFLPWLISQNLV